MDKKLIAVVVEDMVDLAELLTRELTQNAWEAEQFLAFSPALERIKKPPYPDLVLLDLNLPDSPPDNTIQRIPEIQKYSPVLVVSGLTRPEIVDAVESTGAMFYCKSGTGTSFLARVVRALALYRTRHLQAAEENLQQLRQYLQTVPNGR